MSMSFRSEPSVESGTYGSYRYEISNPESVSAVVKIYIPREQSVKSIPGCMLATSSNVEIAGKLKKTMKALFGPDEARHQVFTCTEDEGWVILAPPLYGCIRAIHINDEEICVGDNAFLASLGDIESTSVRQGMKRAFFSGHGLFVKKVEGTGVVFVCAVGSMTSLTLADDEEIIIDTGHLVTWPRHIRHDVQKASKSTTGTGLSGEGMVFKVCGPGSVNVQTRNPAEVAEWVYSTVPPPP